MGGLILIATLESVGSKTSLLCSLLSIDIGLSVVSDAHLSTLTIWQSIQVCVDSRRGWLPGL